MEFTFCNSIKQTCYDSFYPFGILSKNRLVRLDFEPITILYGGNGSGKSTALNVIAERLELLRDSPYNKSNFFPNYVELCQVQFANDLPQNSRIITSDDVFDYILNIRTINEGIDYKREELFENYLETKYSDFQMKSLADVEQLKKVNKAKSKTHSPFLLAMKGAKIYDLDEDPVDLKKWTELENVQTYHEFFARHRDVF